MADDDARIDFLEAVAELAHRDGRYAPEAFLLVCEALRTTSELIQNGTIQTPALSTAERHVPGHAGFHVTGQELLEGFRRHVRREYGNMALFLLHSFGLRRSEDVGEVVFLMVESGLLGKRESDTRNDFAGGYDFAEAFAPDSLLEE
jgi:uncharacterized repeat protein (TIGR04138 family)